MLTEDVPAWGPLMRSTTPLRQSPTRFMTDPSLGVAALGTGPEQLLLDLNATGFHFEGLVVRDRRIYIQPIAGQLSHWRDNNQHEVDIVITLADGRWGALEVKMNPGAVDAAAASLLRFKNKVDTGEDRRAGVPRRCHHALGCAAACGRSPCVADRGPWGPDAGRITIAWTLRCGSTLLSLEIHDS